MVLTQVPVNRRWPTKRYIKNCKRKNRTWGFLGFWTRRLCLAVHVGMHTPQNNGNGQESWKFQCNVNAGCFFCTNVFQVRTHALFQWNSNPWTLLDIYYSKQLRGTTGIRTQTLLRVEKYVTDSQLLKDYIFLRCLITCSWDVLYFRSWNSRCLASVVRAVVVKSEPVMWKVMWRKLVNSKEASKIKIQKFVYSPFSTQN